MTFQELLSSAGKNHLCEVAKKNEGYLADNFSSLSAKYELSDGTQVICYPAEVVTQCCFQREIKKMENNLGAFDSKIQKQLSRNKKSNDTSIEKLEEKFDSETIAKSPCVAFVTTRSGQSDVYNLCPNEIITRY